MVWNTLFFKTLCSLDLCIFSDPGLFVKHFLEDFFREDF